MLTDYRQTDTKTHRHTDRHDFLHLLKSINPFLDYKTQRDAHEALILLLDIFSNICNLSLKENKISTVPEFVDSFFSGIY